VSSSSSRYQMLTLFHLHVHIPIAPLLILFEWSTSRASANDDWQCGNDDLTRWISEATIEKSCGTLKEVINACCIEHDLCYDRQLGRVNCDDRFCRCLVEVTKPSPVCSEEDGPSFCQMVRDFGDSSYHAAGLLLFNVTMSSSEVKTNTTLTKNVTMDEESSNFTSPSPKQTQSTSKRPIEPKRLPVESRASRIKLTNGSKKPVESN